MPLRFDVIKIKKLSDDGNLKGQHIRSKVHHINEDRIKFKCGLTLFTHIFWGQRPDFLKNQMQLWDNGKQGGTARLLLYFPPLREELSVNHPSSPSSNSSMKYKSDARYR